MKYLPNTLNNLLRKAFEFLFITKGRIMKKLMTCAAVIMALWMAVGPSTVRAQLTFSAKYEGKLFINTIPIVDCGVSSVRVNGLLARRALTFDLEARTAVRQQLVTCGQSVGCW